MYVYIYLLLKQGLLHSIPEIKEVEFYMEQDSKNYQGGLKVAPGVYIQFPPTDTRSLANGLHEADLTFDLILLTDCLLDGDQRIYNGTEVTHLLLAEKIHQYISGYSALLSALPDFASLAGTCNDYVVFNSADRINVTHTHRDNTIMKTKQRFKTYIKDFSGAQHFRKIAATLQIEELKLMLPDL